MSQPKQIDTFNRHLDALLHGDHTDPADLQEADQQTLGIARRLAAIDLSAQSELRFSLRRRLAQNARLRSQFVHGSDRNPALQPPAGLAMALPGATLLFVLVFVLSWTFTSLGRLPASGGIVSATAFALPGTALESGLPPADKSPAAPVLAPQPLPTPLAPLQSTTYAPSASHPDQTPSQAVLQTGSITLTRASP